MKYRLSTFSAVACFAVLCCLSPARAGDELLVAGRGPGDSSSSRPAPDGPQSRLATWDGKTGGFETAAAAGRADSHMDGNAVVARAARSLRRLPPLEAKVRHKVDLFGQQLVGAGNYMQAGEGSEKFRMELKIQVADQTSSLLQVSDGRFLWIRRELGPTQTLSRVDLQRVEQAMQGHTPDPWTASGLLAAGGLAQLLAGLSDRFEFDPPVAGSLGEFPVWILRGRWKTEMLAHMLPSQREEILRGRQPDVSQLPDHLPTTIVLALARDDVMPLFPYRVQFRREPGTGTRATARDAAASKPLVTLELFEVRRRAADPTTFSYNPGDQEVADHTDALIQQLLGP